MVNISDFLVRKSSLRQNGKFRQLAGRPEDTAQNLEITDINLETERYGSKSGDSLTALGL